MFSFFLLFFIISVSFDSEHCKRKCETIFSDSPSKLSLCLGTCSSGFSQRERISNNRQRDGTVDQCLAGCGLRGSKENFTIWNSCRKKCFKLETSSNSNPNDFSGTNDADKCSAECERYWKGTVHWKPCIDQCSSTDFDGNKNVNSENNNRNVGQRARTELLGAARPRPERAVIFNIW